MRNRVIAFLMVALILCGCGDRAPRLYDNRMKIASNGTFHTILIDTETGVCYLTSYKGGTCVMVNQDGTPFIANGWRDYEGGID